MTSNFPRRSQRRSSASDPGRALHLLIVLLSIGVLGCSSGTTCVPEVTSSNPARVVDFGAQQDVHFDFDRIDPMLEEMKRLGMERLRFQVLWEEVQFNDPNGYKWDAYDTAFAKLRAAGIKTIGVIWGVPRWARQADCVDLPACPPADPAAFAEFAGLVAERYSSLGVTWEVWNEPNISPAWASGPDPVAYARLLRGAYIAIKAADPSATVISAGLSPTGSSQGRFIAPVEYLEALYDAGVKDYFDAVGWHPYTPWYELGSYHASTAWSQMNDTPVSARSVMIAHGDGRKQIWATEFGLTTQPRVNTEEQQARTLTTAIELWNSYDFAGPLIIFNYRDLGVDPADNQLHYGMFRFDDTPKPAVAAVADAIRIAQLPAPASCREVDR